MAQTILLQSQARLAATTLAARAERLHDALRHLAVLTLALLDATPDDPAAVKAWLDEEGFELDPEGGTFERKEHLARLRARAVVTGAAASGGAGASAAPEGEGDPGGDHVPHSYFWPRDRVDDPGTRRRLFVQRKLGPELARLKRELAGVAWIYYQDITNALMCVPAIDFGTIVPGDFSWQSYHSFWIVTPENDPERAIRWSPPNIDYGGKGLICCVSIPVYKGDDFIGVWTIDVPLSVLLRDTLIHAPIPGQDNFLVSVDGELVAHRTIETVIEKGGGSVYRERIDVLGGDYAGLDLRSLAASGEGTLEVRDAEGRPQLVCYSAVAPTRWILFNAFPMEQVTEARARTLREALDRIQRGDLSFRIERANIDEMAALVDGYNAMAASLERMRSEQEEAIRSLSSPIIEVGDAILAVPIVGAVDEARAADMTGRLLAEIVRVRARAVALDFTGVTRAETMPAEALARIARAVELLGAHCVISGLAPDLARKLAGRSADIGGVRCYGTLKTALAAMMDAGRRGAR